MSTWATNMLRRVATDLQSFGDRRLPPDSADAFLLLLVLLVQEQLGGNSQTSTAGTLVSRALRSMRSLQDRQHEYMYGAPAIVQAGSVGRPKFDIPAQQLSFLVESGFTGTQIAGIIGVSLRAVRRRMADYGLSIGHQYADVPDHELQQIVLEIKMEFPTCGQKQMMGHLRSRGYIEYNRFV